MAPILGIYASQISGHLVNTNFYSIATATVDSGGASSITFSSIPQTYSHLQIRGIGFYNYRAGIQFNGDTGSNYAFHLVGGTGSSTYAVGSANVNGSSATWGNFPNQVSGIPGAFVIDILDYTNTSKTKTTRALSGNDRNGAGDIWLASVLWNSTSAISSITLYSDEGGYPFAQYSTFALYGIKA
jgi:hypothetical protein